MRTASTTDWRIVLDDGTIVGEYGTESDAHEAADAHRTAGASFADRMSVVAPRPLTEREMDAARRAADSEAKAVRDAQLAEARKLKQALDAATPEARDAFERAVSEFRAAA
jgi:hypothetical protein